MATSSKIKFSLESLKKQALSNVEEKILDAKTHLDSLTSEVVLAERRSEWRAVHQQKVSELFHSFASLSDEEIVAAFQSASPAPTLDRAEVARAQRTLNALLEQQASLLAKTGSLVPDAEGNVSFTRVQLSEFFGL